MYKPSVNKVFFIFLFYGYPVHMLLYGMYLSVTYNIFDKLLGIILDNMLHVIRKSYEVGKLHAIYIQAHVYLEATSYDIKL